MSKLRTISKELWRGGDLPVLALIVLLGTVIYGHTLNAPWYLDDTMAILENPAIHDLKLAAADFFSGRWLANLTFSLNYRFGGSEVSGYHMVNIAVHLAASCVTYLLFKRVFPGRRLLQAGGALIFVAHPLQTQAVTYVVQRMTSLAGLLFFLALYLFVRALESRDEGTEGRGQWLYYAASVFCGALAVLTKQNAAVLPLAILLFVRYFSPAGRRLPWRTLLLYLAPFCLLPIFFAARSLLLPIFAGEGISNVGGMPDLVHLKHNSPVNYLVTQFSVIWLYLRLLFIPYGQALDYDFAIVSDIWALRNWFACLGLAALLAVALFLRRRLPTVSFAILWFFLALSVESSIIPLDPVFEHRLFVPMFGFAAALMEGVSRLPARWAAGAIALATLVLALLTWQRNALWNDPLAFLHDNLRQAPRSERVLIDLGNLYMDRGRPAEARELYERALSINPGYVLIHINLARAYAAQNEYHKAVAVLLEGLRHETTHFKLYNNLGVLYNYLGDFAKGASVLQRAASLQPNNAVVHFNLGLSYEKVGMLQQAIYHYRRAASLDHGDPTTHFNLGVVLHRGGDRQGALREFQIAYGLNPGHIPTLYNAALVQIELGDLQGAWRVVEQMRSIDPVQAGQLQIRLREVDAGGG